MTFATTVTTADTNAGVGTDDAPVIDLPASLVNGNVVVLILGCRAGTIDATPTDWTELANGGGSATDMAVFAREVDATWSADTTVTGSFDGFLTWSAIAYQFSGIEDFGTQPPEAAIAFLDSDSTSPDPPSLTPTGGAKDYVWIAAYFNRDSGVTTTWPTNYTNTITTQSGGGSHRMSSGDYELNAASENPGVFVATNNDWSACTIAIHPAAGATANPHHPFGHPFKGPFSGPTS